MKERIITFPQFKSPKLEKVPLKCSRKLCGYISKVFTVTPEALAHTKPYFCPEHRQEIEDRRKNETRSDED